MKKLRHLLAVPAAALMLTLPMFGVAPTLVAPADGETVLQAPPITTRYLTQAREDYVTEKFADYRLSVIKQFTTASSDHNDRPRPVKFEWEVSGEGGLYTLEISESPDFEGEVRRLEGLTKTEAEVYHLRSGTEYYWRVTEHLPDGGKTTVSDTARFVTEDSVRWIYAEGGRNIRDLGGWNGLNQGLVYRGSELNPVGSHGLGLTEAGRKVLADELGIVTDMDFRAVTTESRGEEKYLTGSAIGPDVKLLNLPIGNFLSAFSDSYRDVIAAFAEPANYPIYMHCWGGADRTGTVAFLLEALCGVSEEDLAIDLELTSFASFGYRYRYDNGNYLYASTVAKLKTYPGDTLKEKAESYARRTLGLSTAQISNIRSILAGSGATVKSAEDRFWESGKGGDLTLELVCPDGQKVSAVNTAAVTGTGSSLDFTFDEKNGRLTVDGRSLAEVKIIRGVLEIALDDGSVLRCGVVSDLADSVAADIAGGSPAGLFAAAGIAVREDGDGLILDADGTFTVPHELVKALYDAGIESMKLSLDDPSHILHFDVFDPAGNPLMSADGGAEPIVIPFTDGGDIAITLSGTTAIPLPALQPVGTALAEAIIGGSYRDLIDLHFREESGGITLTSRGNGIPFTAKALDALRRYGCKSIRFEAAAEGEGIAALRVVWNSNTEGIWAGEESTIPAKDGRAEGTFTFLLDEEINGEGHWRHLLIQPLDAEGRVIGAKVTLSHFDFPMVTDEPAMGFPVWALIAGAAVLLVGGTLIALRMGKKK